MLLANREPVYGSSQTYDRIYSNLLEKRSNFGHLNDIESLLFYYQHDKFEDFLTQKGEDPKKYLKLIQVMIGKNLDKFERHASFDNMVRLTLGIQKISHLTQFHPMITTKLLIIARRCLIDGKSKQHLHSLLNMLYVSNNLKQKYQKILEGESSDKIKQSILHFS